MKPTPYAQAIKTAQALHDAVGLDHPNTQAAIQQVYALTPPEIVERLPPEEQRQVRFLQAGLRHQETVERYGREHPAAFTTMLEVMEYAPDELKEAMHQKAADMGLLPKPGAYTSEGEPLYSLNDVAATLGISPDEAQQELAKMLDQREAMGLDTSGMVQDASDVHRVQ